MAVSFLYFNHRGERTGRMEEQALKISEQAVQAEPDETREEKAERLRWILTELIRRAMQENSEELTRSIRDCVIKELDYQFRLQEEREEKRESLRLERSEEYYRRLDELLRSKKQSPPRKLWFRRVKKTLPKTS